MRAALFPALLFSAGCCLLPWPRSALLRPAGVVVVRDGTTGAPLPGAKVTVRRFNLGPPPATEDRRYLARTDLQGRAAFTALTSREWVLPLMMHGVPQWAFDVCVESTGHAAEARTWLIQRHWQGALDADAEPRLVVTLPPGARTCREIPAWNELLVQVDSRPPSESRPAR